MAKQIQAMPEFAISAGLHIGIMRRIFLLKVRIHVLLGGFLLFVNLFISAWHMWSRMAELETVSAFRALNTGFEMSYDYFITLFSVMKDFFPVTSVVIFLLNLLTICYVLYFYFKMNKSAVIKVGS